MFRPEDNAPLGYAPAAPAAVPTPAPEAGGGLPASRAPTPAPCGLRPSVALNPARIDLSRIDWVPDLAEDIGSRRWCRGMATLMALVATALAFWPDFSALEAAPASRLDIQAEAQYRAAGLGLSTPRTPRLAPPPRALKPIAFVPERPSVALTTALPAGESLGRLLQRAGVSGSDAARATELIAAVVPLDTIAPGTRVALVLGPRPAPGQPRRLDSAALRARFDLALAVRRAGFGLALQRQPIAVETTPLRIRGQVGESLYRSARAAGAPPSTIQEYLQALDAHLNLEGDVAPEDSFDLVFASRRAATGESEVGALLYAGLDRTTSAGPRPVVELLRWGREGGFYSADALAEPRVVQSGAGLLMPVNGHVTSLYGQRFHPILGYARMHAGVDFGAAWGSPIIAAADGVVSYAGYHGGHGNFVRLEHGGGLGTGYGHMSRIAVAPGERVRAGEVIGYVGSTGLSTGPHLHYEMYRNGQTVDPLGAGFVTQTVTRQVDPKELGAFRTRLAQLKALRPGALFAAAARAAQHIALS